MGYLSDCEHDIFVSYAHSSLNDWSKRLIDDVRKYIATGLGLKDPGEVDVWMDHKLGGNQPLTGELREQVEKAGVLLVLMTEWYLASSWCRDELGWSVDAVRQKPAGNRLFVVRVRATADKDWPEVFKDERGHPLPGYDFLRDDETDQVRMPKGSPTPEHAFDGKAYYEAVGKLASDIVGELKALEKRTAVLPDRPPGVHEPPPRRERIFLAAAPAEDVDNLRDELAELLRQRGCDVVPDDNPIDLDVVHQSAAAWASGCDRFVQILGNMSGTWPHDKAGFVLYQHELAKRHGKPSFVYRAPSLDTVRIRNPEYRALVESFGQVEPGELPTFADQVTRVIAPPPGGGGAQRHVFVMASPRDQRLEREIRRLLGELHAKVLPLERSGPGGCEVAAVVDDERFLNIVRRCGAMLLLNGKVKEDGQLWVDDRVADIELDILPKLDGRLRYAIVDDPPEPRLTPRAGVFLGDSPTLKQDLEVWLRTLNGGASPLGGGSA